MVLVRPQAGRAKIAQGPDGLLISIPVKKHAYMMIFMPMFLALWVFGTVMAANQSRAGQQRPGKGFLAVWLIFAVGWGLLLIFAWLWNMLGTEIVKVSASSLTISRSLFGLKKTREYVTADIEAIRPSQYYDQAHSFSSLLSYFGLTGGNVAFDYGMKTVRFAVQVDEAEAKHIASLINKRLGRETSD